MKNEQGQQPEAMNSSALGNISVLSPSQRREQERLQKEKAKKDAAEREKRRIAAAKRKAAEEKERADAEAAYTRSTLLGTIIGLTISGTFSYLTYAGWIKLFTDNTGLLSNDANLTSSIGGLLFAIVVVFAPLVALIAIIWTIMYIANRL